MENTTENQNSYNSYDDLEKAVECEDCQTQEKEYTFANNNEKETEPCACGETCEKNEEQTYKESLSLFQQAINDRYMHPKNCYEFTFMNIKCAVFSNGFNWSGGVELPLNHPDINCSINKLNSIYKVHNGISLKQNNRIIFNTLGESDYILMSDHYYDSQINNNLTYRTFDFVKNEVINLAKQIISRKDIKNTNECDCSNNIFSQIYNDVKKNIMADEIRYNHMKNKCKPPPKNKNPKIVNNVSRDNHKNIRNIHRHNNNTTISNIYNIEINNKPCCCHMPNNNYLICNMHDNIDAIIISRLLQINDY